MINSSRVITRRRSYIPTQIYASIVGGDGSGSVTQQNYIDFIYSTLSAIGSADFPR